MNGRKRIIQRQKRQKRIRIYRWYKEIHLERRGKIEANVSAKRQGEALGDEEALG